MKKLLIIFLSIFIVKEVHAQKRGLRKKQISHWSGVYELSHAHFGTCPEKILIRAFPRDLFLINTSTNQSFLEFSGINYRYRHSYSEVSMKGSNMIRNRSDSPTPWAFVLRTFTEVRDTDEYIKFGRKNTAIAYSHPRTKNGFKCRYKKIGESL